jgi:histidine triad (HIT) family protein
MGCIGIYATSAVASRDVTACTFCGVATGTTSAAIVLRNDAVVAFLDHAPLFPGHTLVIPRAHHVTLEDLPPASVEPFFAAVAALSRAVRTATGAEGSFVAMNNVVSQSVPHLHAHVVPRNRGDGLRGFFWPRRRYADAAAREAMRAAIAAAL